MMIKTDNLINITKGVGISFLLTMILLLIYSCILTNTNVGENTISPAIVIITGVSLLIGSSIANIKSRKNGLLNGALIGGIYLLLIYIISSLINGNFSMTINSIIMIIASILCGGLGGIFGINKGRR